MSEQSVIHIIIAKKPFSIKFSNIQHVIGIVSGNGGIGKSLVTSLFATMLSPNKHRCSPPYPEFSFTLISYQRIFFPAQEKGAVAKRP